MTMIADCKSKISFFVLEKKMKMNHFAFTGNAPLTRHAFYRQKQKKK